MTNNEEALLEVKRCVHACDMLNSFIASVQCVQTGSDMTKVNDNLSYDQVIKAVTECGVELGVQEQFYLKKMYDMMKELREVTWGYIDYNAVANATQKCIAGMYEVLE